MRHYHLQAAVRQRVQDLELVRSRLRALAPLTPVNELALENVEKVIKVLNRTSNDILDLDSIAARKKFIQALHLRNITVEPNDSPEPYAGSSLDALEVEYLNESLALVFSGVALVSKHLDVLCT